MQKMTNILVKNSLEIKAMLPLEDFLSFSLAGYCVVKIV